MHLTTESMHACFLYDTEEEQQTVVTSFIRQGLAQGARVLYLYDTLPSHALIDALDTAGLCVEHLTRTGQLRFETAENTYVRGGEFDPQRMVAYLGVETLAALSEQYSGLHVTGEMMWIHSHLRDFRPLLRYELALNQLLPNTCVGLCQYDKRYLLLDIIFFTPFIA